MGRRSLALAAALLAASFLGYGLARWQAGRRAAAPGGLPAVATAPGARAEPGATRAGATKAAGGAPAGGVTAAAGGAPAGGATPAARGAAPAAGPAPPPMWVGDTAELAAAAVDATAGRPTNEAVVALARRFVGRPWRHRPGIARGGGAPERLVLDLTGFDERSLVEQLLALANSRRVRSRTAARERFAEHVRWLRYADGRVEACHRWRDGRRWALAAEGRGYVVNLTPFLPGARGREAVLPVERTCAAAGERPRRIRQAFLPRERLAAAAPSLRDGDVVAVVPRAAGRDLEALGVLERRGERLQVLRAVPGQGVRRGDLAQLLASRRDGIGLVLLRPLPNPEPGGSGRGG